MIVAMMGPSLAPIASLHLEAVHPRAGGLQLVACGGAFVLGYFLVWTAFGLPIFGLAAVEEHVASTAPPVAVAAGATILVVAGLYQMTPLRARYLASCNRHLGAQAHLPHAPNARHPLQDVSAGLAHGVDCLGACGGCMLALVAVGLMNVPWMVAITLIVWVEKVWRHGDHLAVVVGLALVLLGILAAADTRLIRGL